MAERNCAYCREELREGATVCHACAREQPAVKSARNQKLLIYGLVGVAVLVVGGWLGWTALDQMARAKAVARIVECVHLHGDKTMDADFVNHEIDDGMTQTGKGWRAGTEYAALVFIRSGATDTGTCFNSQETMFSD